MAPRPAGIAPKKSRLDGIDILTLNAFDTIRPRFLVADSPAGSRRERSMFCELRFWLGRRTSCLTLLVSSLLLVEGGPFRLTAQVLSGSLVGNVTDASGSGVPGAAVRVVQTQTNDTREVTTNDSGGYTLSTVPAGSYQVLISKPGFQTFTTRNIEVRLNTVVRVDASLQVGQVSEQVEVTAQAAALQTDKADVHSEFTTQQMVNLPQPTRAYQGIVALMPGIAPPAASSGGTNNPGKSMQISANGTSRSGTTVRIDGVTDTNPWVQFFSTYVPSMEAIETVNVATTSMDA